MLSSFILADHLLWWSDLDSFQSRLHSGKQVSLWCFSVEDEKNDWKLYQKGKRNTFNQTETVRKQWPNTPLTLQVYLGVNYLMSHCYSRQSPRRQVLCLQINYSKFTDRIAQLSVHLILSGLAPTSTVSASGCDGVACVLVLQLTHGVVKPLQGLSGSVRICGPFLKNVV